MHEPAGVVEILVQNQGEYPLFWSTVSEYPPQMKIVRESKSESFRIPPQNENCQRIQIREFQNTPQNENCHKVQIWEFQNTPPSQIAKTSDFKLQNSLKIREIYVETNLLPPPRYHSL